MQISAHNFILALDTSTVHEQLKIFQVPFLIKIYIYKHEVCTLVCAYISIEIYTYIKCFGEQNVR